MDWEFLEVCLRNNKTKHEAENRIAMEIKGSRNPFDRSLDLLSDCLNRCKSKPNSKSVFVIINELEKLTLKTPQFLNRELKSRALTIALKQKNSLIIEKVCNLYRLVDDCLLWLDTARSLVLSKKFSEACIVVNSLKLHSHFDVEQIIIPLFLQDKISLLEIYIKDNRSLQVEFLQYLDHLLSDSQKSPSLASRLHIPDSKSEKWNSKSIGKLISRLLKLYDIPPETCPNLCQVRGIGALKYLVHRKYIEKALDHENWTDLVLGTVGVNPLLQEELLCILVSYNEALEALKWARHFKLQRTYWPPALLELQVLHPEISENNLAMTQHEDDDVWEIQEPEYLTFRLSPSDIHVVQTIDEFKRCIDDIQNYDVVAMDGEWKPSFGLHQEKLSLLQIAVWDSVFLLDILALQICLDSSDWDLLSDRVLCNSAIHKLGFGLASDLQQLTKMMPKTRSRFQKREKIFDLALLVPKMELHYPELLVGQMETGPFSAQDCKGLSELTRKTLGKPLDKSMQFSDWEKRPLREAQIIYAAMDAFCLLQIFEVWNQKALDLHQDFFVLAEKAQNSTSIPLLATQTRSNKEGEVSLEEQIMSPFTTPAFSSPPIPVSEFKVVVDTMLQGLGKHLRICGIDTAILHSENYHDQAAKIALEENRMILTSGAPYQQLRQHVPEGHCLKVPNGLNCDDQARFIFRHFNVQLKLDDVFSRCSVCNGGKYIEIPSSDLERMWERNKELNWALQPSPLQSIINYPGGSVDIEKGVICQNSISIGLQKLLPHHFGKATPFCICASCGKVYWEGSHHGRVMRKLSPFLHAAEESSKKVQNVNHTKADDSQNEEQPSMTRCTKSNPGSSMLHPILMSDSGNDNSPSASYNSLSLPPPPEMYISHDEDDFDDYEVA